MSNPMDLRMTLSYETKTSLSRIGREILAPDPATQARLPGFYVRAYQNEGYDDVLKMTRVPLDLGQKIAEAFDLAAGSQSHACVAAGACVVGQHAQDRATRRTRLKEQVEAAQAELAAIEAEERYGS